MPYLLDTNVFIEAKNRYYGLDFCPAFWDWLISRNEDETVYSVEMVGNEIIGGSDDLAVWAAERGSTFFLEPPDPGMLPALANVATWVIKERNYTEAARNTFLSTADFYLVAHALADQCVIVTHEKKSDSLKKIKIPDVCTGVGVDVITPFDMLLREGARFQLGASPRGRRSTVSASIPT